MLSQTSCYAVANKKLVIMMVEFKVNGDQDQIHRTIL